MREVGGARALGEPNALCGVGVGQLLRGHEMVGMRRAGIDKKGGGKDSGAG